MQGGCLGLDNQRQHLETYLKSKFSDPTIDLLNKTLVVAQLSVFQSAIQVIRMHTKI